MSTHPYFAYVIVTNGDPTAGVSGAQFGIDYLTPDKVGVDVFSWTNCATLQFPTTGWPAAGTGMLTTWDVNSACQTNEPGGAGTGVIATIGYFYCAAYTPDALRLTARPSDGVAKVASCNATEDIVPSGAFGALGHAAFSPGGAAAGFNPCQ